MQFSKYYAELLRKRTSTEPRADEALRDYRDAMARIEAGIYF